MAMKQEYFQIVLPQHLSLLSTSVDVPSIQRRVAAFALSRLLSPENNPHHVEVSRIVLPLVQKPLLQLPEELRAVIDAADSDVQQYGESYNNKFAIQKRIKLSRMSFRHSFPNGPFPNYKKLWARTLTDYVNR